MSIVLSDYYRLYHKEAPLCKGIDRFVHDIHGFFKRNNRFVFRLRARAEAILLFAEQLSYEDDEHLQLSLHKLQVSVRCSMVVSDEYLDKILAYLCESSFRVMNMRPYVVQVMAALAIYRGYGTEMLPGEGKTLTASLAAIVVAWKGISCHVVTSNDYLAERDSQLMAPLYHYCGVTVTAILGNMQDTERRQQYHCGVVYATSKELLADYLRDQLKLPSSNDDICLLGHLATETRKETVMRGLHTAIIDEADSVLVDDAMTPLIISVSSENRLLKEAVVAVHDLILEMCINRHYVLNTKYQEIEFTEEGEQFLLQKAASLPVIWQPEERRNVLVKQALSARDFYLLNQHYVIIDAKIVIVDEKTGRLMEGRSWSFGLHQAIEAKESLALTDPTSTHARMSFQRFFRQYQQLSGMSGTLQGIERELWQVYLLPVVKIPSHRLSARQRYRPKVFLCSDDKWHHVVQLVVSLHKKRVPILVGTRTIQSSEALANRLGALGFQCDVLNAISHQDEANTIVTAGQEGSITIATNMAGRGTDIHISSGVETMGGLHVITTEFHDSKRVDIQLYGRCARQGQKGVVFTFLSLDDMLMEQYCPTWLVLILKKIHWERLSLVVLSMMQYIAKELATLNRRRMLEQDFKLGKMLSFARKHSGKSNKK